jgi:hypothetical protein
MPHHRRSEILPQRLLDKVRSASEHAALGRVHMIRGGGLRGSRKGLFGKPIDVQYSLKDSILTRTEFLRDNVAIPMHMAHFDPESGKRLGIVLDL